MSLWKIAWKSIQQRGLASALTAVSMALGVTLVVAVLSIYGVVAESFRNNSSLGYNMIVGAKGGKLQLTLNTVYYLSSPVENIPYDYYLEFLPPQQRAAELKNSRRYQAALVRQETAELQALASGAGGIGAAPLTASAGSAALESVDEQRKEMERPGQYAGFVHFAIPLLLGDYFGEFRVVGTSPDLFDKLALGASGERRFEFAQGRPFQTWTEENGYFEAVLGATVAREQQVEVGEVIYPTHGDPEGHGHGQGFTIVGILEPTGTPHDRAAFVNMEGFYLMEGHAKPDDEEEAAAGSAPESEADEAPAPTAEAANSHDASSGRRTPLPIEEREVTSLLVRADPIMSRGLINTINEGRQAQAVSPMAEISTLLDNIVGPVQTAFLAIAGLICVVSGVSILVSIYNSMSERRREIAVMRALGAGRGTVMTVILIESLLLALGGFALGWTGGHLLNWAASPYIEAQTGVWVGFWSLSPPVDLVELLGATSIIDTRLNVPSEFLVIPLLMVLAVAVGFWPAISAYRTDVAKWLGS